MKKLRKLINHNGIFLASLIFVIAISLPQLLTGDRPVSAAEQLMLDMTRNIANVSQLRAAMFALIIINTTLTYALLAGWMSKRRAGLSIFMLASIPSWLLMQITLPQLAVAMTPLLIALWAFDRAGRSDKPVAWYIVSGLGATAAWVIQPIGTSIIMVLGALLLIAVKPRYAKHIARQASLILIVLAGTIGLISLASWRFGLGGQDYIVAQLGNTLVVTLVPRILWTGPLSYYIGLPGVALIPVAISALAGLGAWQLFAARKRPRNVFLLVLPLVLGFVGLQLSGVSALMLLYVAMIGLAVWAVMGAQYLHNSWKRVFPHNKLAKSLGDGLIALMLASLVMYSFWYINRAWGGNPDAKTGTSIEWNGRL